jgi:transcriptional regulator with XRE-family HTH domain
MLGIWRAVYSATDRGEGPMSNEQTGTHSDERLSMPNDFGSLLRRFRLRQGFSQQELAEAVFESSRKSSISELENNPTRVPQPNTLRRLATVLRLTDEERSQLVDAAERRRRPPIPQQQASPLIETTEPANSTPTGALEEPEPDVRHRPGNWAPQLSRLGSSP